MPDPLAAPQTTGIHALRKLWQQACIVGLQLKPSVGQQRKFEGEMKMQRILKSAGLFVVPAIMAFSVAANADQWDKRTTITVNESIEVPGAVLPAGTYILKLVDSPSDRHIVQVMNEREDHVFATVLAIPNYRLEPRGKTVLTFYEVPAGQPQPVRAWFYPGDNYGQEFVYGKERFTQLSQTNTMTTTPAEPEPQPSVAAVEPAPAPEPAPVQVEAAPAPEPVIVAQNDAPPAMPSATPAPVMPQTSSNLPLFGLIGFLSIGAALALGSFAKRIN
jgi:hypothetical protein